MCGLLVAVLTAWPASGCTLLFPFSDTGGCDDGACGTAGGTCSANEQCGIECTEAECRCPAGHSCVITYASAAPQVVIDCSEAKRCELRCSNGDQCNQTMVYCGEGDCRVACSPQFSCFELSLQCDGGCELDCAGIGSCAGASVGCRSADRCDLTCGNEACGNVDLNCDGARECSASCFQGGNGTCDGAQFVCAEPTNCDLSCYHLVSLCGA